METPPALPHPSVPPHPLAVSGLCPRDVAKRGSQGSLEWQRCPSLLGSAEGVREGTQGGLGTPAGSMAEAGMQESTQASGAWKGHFSPAGTSTSGLRCRKAG